MNIEEFEKEGFDFVLLQYDDEREGGDNHAVEYKYSSAGLTDEQFIETFDTEKEARKFIQQL